MPWVLWVLAGAVALRGVAGLFLFLDRRQSRGVVSGSVAARR